MGKAYIDCAVQRNSPKTTTGEMDRCSHQEKAMYRKEGDKWHKHDIRKLMNDSKTVQASSAS
eukprot:scaffold154390_cov65-Attheya_sp.AAC.1